MEKIEIDGPESDEVFYCPVTNEILCDEGYVGLSKATLLSFWDSDSSFEFGNKLIEDKYNQYLKLLKENVEECSFCRPDIEIIAIKLVLKELEKENKKLTLYTLNFYNSSLSFCIDMSYKPTK